MKNLDRFPDDETPDEATKEEVEGTENAFLAGFDGDDDPIPDEGEMETEAKPDSKDAAEASASAGDGDEPAAADKPDEPADNPLAARVRSLEGKLGTVTDQLSRALSENQTLKDTATPTTEQVTEAAESSEKFDELAAEFPEWAEAMKEQITLVESRLMGKIPTAEAIDGAINEAYQATRALNKLDIKHLDWEETVQSVDFKDWEKAQNAEIQVLAGSEDPKDASKMLDLYKQSKQDAKSDEPDAEAEAERLAAEKQRRLDDAIAPTRPGSTSRRERAPDVDDAFEEGFYGNRERAR